MSDFSSSSDDARSARPLNHAQTWICANPLELQSGGHLEEVAICFETWGQLNSTGDNAILICHALSGDSHVVRHDEDDDPGWWEVLVGPGRPIDTNHFFVICSNVLGGCRGTTGPNFLNPETGRRFGAEFPVVTVADMVEAQGRLIDYLGIDVLRAVVGGSLGGLQALEWAVRFPDRVQSAVVIAAAPRLSSQGIAFDVVGRNAIRHDPHFAAGQYYEGPSPEAGLALARMLAHVTYLSDESMRSKFDPTRLQPRAIETGFESTFSVGTYLAYQGDRFVERFDANSYITLSTAMDLFDLGDSDEKVRESLRLATCRWLFLSFSSDWLYPPSASKRLADALMARGCTVSRCVIESPAGHDSFLLEEGMRQGARMIASFLSRPEISLGSTSDPTRLGSRDMTNIFHSQRLDYQLIFRLMPSGASVVDLGCGNGELLTMLRERGHHPLLGVEWDADEVVLCVENGLPVIHADLDQGLASIPDQSFDVALLSQTLQSIEDVPGVLDEIVRIGHRGIVSFPNFAHAPMREMFMRQGRLPKGEGGYGYEWHNTPNRRFPSILDFQDLCEQRNIQILEAIFVNSLTGDEVVEEPNLNADTAVFVLSR